MIVHITICLILIATILLQAGRGGGLTEAFGGETAQSIFGTQTPKILKKATTVSAIFFLITSLALGMITARRGKSVFDRVRFPNIPVARTTQPEAVPEAKQTEETAPAEQPGNQEETPPAEETQEQMPAKEKEGPISQ